MSRSDDTPIIYRHVWLYQALMRVLHLRGYDGRYRVVADLVPEGCSVTELCAGDARLYLKYLQQKNVRYVALDNSRPFVEAGRQAGIDFREANVRSDPVPEADVVIIQAAFHIFHEHRDEVMAKLLGAARQRLVIVEPVSNLSSSSNPLVAALAKRLTKPRSGDGYVGFRYDAASFRAFAEAQPTFERLLASPDGRENIAVFRSPRASVQP